MQALVMRAWDGHNAMWRLVLVACALLLVTAMMTNDALAAPPPANSVIGNQATATYTDATNTVRQTTSNLVKTTVTQVFSHTLVADVTKLVAPGGVVNLPFTLTNTGNGTDSYNFSQFQLTTDQFDITNVQIFPDGNGDGLPDNFTDISVAGTGSVLAGQAFKFVVSGTVSASRVNNDTAQIRFGAVSVGAPLVGAVDANNYTASATAPTSTEQGVLGTVQVSTGAVVGVTKAYSVITGAINNTITVTLTYTNTGGAAATNVVLTDIIGSAGLVTGTSTTFDTSEMTYAGNLLCNGIACAPASFTTAVPATSAAGTVSVTILTLASGQSGKVQFDLNVVNATPKSEKTINAAGYNWTGGVAQATNQATYQVAVSGLAGVLLTGQTLAGPVDQGSVVVFNAVTVENTGAATDTFNLSSLIGSYPAGSTFSFTDTNGVPLVDSNGDGIADTGPITPNAMRTINVRVQLPPDATITGPVSAPVTAKSTVNSTVSSTDNVVVTNGIQANSVDLTNISAFAGSSIGGTGFASGDSVAAATQTQTANPGSTVVFFLKIENKSASPNNYDLSAAGTYAVTAGAADTAGALPAGWVVVFRDANGATVTNTGNIPGSGSGANFKELQAIVTVPSTATAGDQAVFFRIFSPTFGADGLQTAGYDVIHDKVTVNRVATLTLTPDSTRQIFPSGSADIAHKLCVSGNTGTDTNGVTIAVTDTKAWQSVLFFDTNDNGVADAGEPQYVAATHGVLAANTCVSLVQKVFAPAGAASGVANTFTLAATANTAAPVLAMSASAQDVVTVVVGNLSLVKEQQTVDCTSGAAAAPQSTFTQGQVSNVAPGTCLMYRISVQNLGSDAATNLVISDSTPTYTSFLTTPAACTPKTVSGVGTVGTIVGGVANAIAPTNAATGTVAFNVGSLASGATEQVTFCVQLDK